MLSFSCWLLSWSGNTILPIRGQRDDASRSEGFAHGVTIVAFIKAQAFGAAPPFPDFAAIAGFEYLPVVMAIGFTHRTIQGVAVGSDDQVAFAAANTMFSGVSDLVFRPLFDLLTLASW